MEQHSRRIENLTKSKSDKREYLYKELGNKLKVLLISDIEADKSAGSLNVNIGSLSDPEDFPGLAHFCEHMLFMGTEKYPKEDEYSEFLNANSGTYNAFTDIDATNYYFDISNESFVEALDRFAQFFLKPLFVSDVVEREMKAVDSENKKNLQSDLWRFMQLQRSEAKEGSVFNRFSTGNLETLNKPNIREALLDMHSKYYSSELMSLVILSPKSIEEMEKLIDSLFTDVPKIDNLTLPKYDKIPAYDSTNLGFFYHVMPVKDSDSINFYWFLPDASKHYKKKPLNYLSSLLGHEGPNSLTSSLIKDDLISALTCGSDHTANTYSQFFIQINLTKKGLENYNEVIKRVFYFLHIVQNQDINKRYFEEIKQISQLKFDFKNKEHAMNYVCDLSYNFKNYPSEDILTGPSIIEEFDEKLIKTYLDSLHVDNMNIYMVSRDFESKCTLTEKWYETKFTKEKINEEFLKQHQSFKYVKEEKVCNHILDYPPENVFIPKSLEQHPECELDRTPHPEKLVDENGIVVWYKRDYTFNLPKAIVICQIYLNKHGIGKSWVEYEALAYVWNSIIENELKEISYMASEANLQFNFHVNNEGLYLQVSGFNYSLKNALVELIKIFKNITAHDKHEKLKVQVRRHIQEYSNFYFRVPYSQAIAYLEYLLVDPHATPEDKTKVLDRGIDIEEIVKFVERFHSESRFEWLIQGNVQKDETIEMAKLCQEMVQKDKLSLDKTVPFRTVIMGTRSNYVYITKNINPNEQNSVICSFFQCGKLDYKGTCTLLVIESLLKDKFFNDLRTKQSLGYIAMLFHREFRCNEGLACLVQSAVKSPEYIWLKIKEFFEENQSYIKQLSDEIFSTHVNSVIVEKKQKDVALKDEVTRNANEIKKRQFVFDRKEKYISILENLKKEELINFFEDHFVNNIRRLDVEVLASQHIEENEKLIIENKQIAINQNFNRVIVKSIEDFKRRNSLYPDFFTLIEY